MIIKKELRKGFSVENLDRMREFYQTYSISSTLSTILELKNSATLSQN